jgi:hypothetical protein
LRKRFAFVVGNDGVGLMGIISHMRCLVIHQMFD